MKTFWLGAITTLLVPVVSHAGDSSTFRIDSYVPLKYTDFRWNISGGGNLNGNGHDESIYDALDFAPSNYSTSNQRDYQSLNLQSGVGYDYFTLPFACNLALSVVFQADHAKNSSSSLRTYSPRLKYMDSSETSSRNSGYTISPSVGFTGYIFKRFFTTGSARFMYYHASEHDTSSDINRYYDSSSVYPNVDLFTSNMKAHASSYNTVVTVGAGYGRFLSADFAYTALSIMRELNAHGLVLRQPSTDEWRQLCDTIVQYRQHHAVDKRYWRISALKAILSYLYSCRIVKDIDPYMPFVISDVWDYYPQSRRQFGYQVTANLEMNYVSFESQQDYEYIYYSGPMTKVEEKHSRDDGRVAIIGGAGYAKPLSYHWQLDAQVHLWYVANRFTRRDYPNPIAVDRGFFGHQAITSIAYCYDARTTLRSTLEIQRNLNQYYSTTLGIRGYAESITTAVTYRPSVPTTLSLSFSANWEKTSNSDQYDLQHWHSYQLTARIDHWLY